MTVNAEKTALYCFLVGNERKAKSKIKNTHLCMQQQTEEVLSGSTEYVFRQRKTF